MSRTNQPVHTAGAEVVRSGRGRHRRPARTNWTGLAERVLGGWPMTLRVALLLVILLAGCMVGLVVVLGFTGTACVAGISVLFRVANRRAAQPI
ncbi:hypothetical protein [Actinocrispum wychmicini]|uniref:hypothetical protein n=1 Tax=Actinocrispum wychmicini TaxID=1213861 RepID=UPI0010492DE1|nr:hypothetical protein [Actinocrispum wychmicini]